MRDPKLKNINSLFEKYKKTLVAPEASVKLAFVEVIDDMLKIEIDVKAVSYTVSSRTLALSLPSVLKSEILQHQDDIIAHMKGRLGPKNAPQAII